MASFHYRAVDNRGTPLDGWMTAVNVVALEDMLRAKGYWLVQADEQDHRSPTGHRRVKVTQRNLVEFTIQMHHLLTAGMPLPQALHEVAQESVDPQFGSMLKAILRAVESGLPLHEAMEAYQSSFPGVFVNLIQAGEEGGALPEAFAELRRYLEWVERIQGDVKQATIYPAMIVLAMGIFMVLLFSFVIPRFATVLIGLKVELPMPTVIVMAASDVMVSMWWVLPLLLITLPLVAVIARKQLSKAAYTVDRFKLQLPLVGELLRMIVISRFTHTFAVLLRSGLPLLQCLNLCQRVVGNKVLEKALAQIEHAVAEGATVTESISRHPIFPPMVRQMTSVGEAAGKLEHTMSSVSAYYNEEIPRRVKKLFGVMEPTVTLLLVGIVGFVALALFMPLMSLMGGIG